MKKSSVTTPIADFVNQFQENKFHRFHMPGHKGQSFLGCESGDITEITGADSLYEAKGIIEESEKNTSILFQTGGSFFSTEGSSHCIKAMLFLLLQSYRGKERPYIIAGRNAHKSFLYSAALLDFDIFWFYGNDKKSICSCNIRTDELEKEIDRILCEKGYPPIGIYITTPDYLGNFTDLKRVSSICQKKDLTLAVDNAHGAYLHFLEEPKHPMDLGADLCCDSAHKTLPVLTGGAYLHISKKKGKSMASQAKQALAVFGSTSPSYLILQSLDLCNRYLAREYRAMLKDRIVLLKEIKEQLKERGFRILATEPLKLTLCFSYVNEKGDRFSANWLAGKLEEDGIYCEYSDPEFLVFMFTPENSREEMIYLKESLFLLGKSIVSQTQYSGPSLYYKSERCSRLSIRQAVFGSQELIPVREAVGRICATPVVSCPPAIPIVVSGEIILKEDLDIFDYYGIENISVVSSVEAE